MASTSSRRGHTQCVLVEARVRPTRRARQTDLRPSNLGWAGQVSPSQWNRDGRVVFILSYSFRQENSSLIEIWKASQSRELERERERENSTMMNAKQEQAQKLWAERVVYRRVVSRLLCTLLALFFAHEHTGEQQVLLRTFNCECWCWSRSRPIVKKFLLLPPSLNDAVCQQGAPFTCSNRLGESARPLPCCLFCWQQLSRSRFRFHFHLSFTFCRDCAICEPDRPALAGNDYWYRWFVNLIMATIIHSFSRLSSAKCNCAR